MTLAADFIGPRKVFLLSSGGENGIYPGVINKSRSPNTEIHDILPLSEVPNNWERNHFFVDDIPINYYTIRAEKERGVIVGCSGLKSEASLSPEAIQDFNDAGLSVILMVLPNTKRSLGFMPHLYKLFKDFALKEDSPAHTSFSDHLPKFLYGHSTGGAFVIRLSSDNKTKQNTREKYKMVFSEAPFADTAGASLHDSWLARSAFTAYAYWNKDYLPEETLGGLYYLHYSEEKTTHHENLKSISTNTENYLRSTFMRNQSLSTNASTSSKTLMNISFAIASIYFPVIAELNKISKDAIFKLNIGVKTIKDLYFPNKSTQQKPWYMQGNPYRIPTYGQILEDQHAGRRLTQLIRENKKTSSIPATIIATKEDPFSCIKTIKKDLIQPLKATFLLAEKGLHNPLSTSKTSRKRLIEEITPHTENIIPTETNSNKATSTWTIKTLGSRFSRAFQNPTSLLDPITGPLKRFF